MNHAPWPHPLIAREGWPYLALAVAAAVLVTVFAGWWSAPLWLIALFVLQFFRDPPRAVPVGERLVLSPADGRVISIEVGVSSTDASGSGGGVC